MFIIDCIDITLIDDKINEIKIGCESLKIEAIYIWGLKGTTTNHGSWFEETESVKQYFRVTDSNNIVSC